MSSTLKRAARKAIDIGVRDDANDFTILAAACGIRSSPSTLELESPAAHQRASIKEVDEGIQIAGFTHCDLGVIELGAENPAASAQPGSSACHPRLRYDPSPR